MKQKLLYLLLAIIIITALHACIKACLHKNTDDDHMIALKAPFARLTQSVNSAMRYKAVPPNLNDLEIVKFATASNPALLTPFQNYNICVKAIGSETVLLLCDSANGRSLLEDISSTPFTDEERWRNSTVASGCYFIINEIPKPRNGSSIITP